MPLTRRDALKRTFLFSAGLLAPGTLHRLLAQQPPLSTSAGGIHLLALGDFGTNDQNQIAVARAMEQYASRLPAKPAAVLAVGDNFYGPMSPERFATGFEDMYRREHLDCPFYVCLGNHDYEPTKSTLQLAYAQDNPASRWKLPSKWYTVTVPGIDKSPLARIIMLDSNYQGPLTAAEQTAQIHFLESELNTATTAPWTIVVAHHPLFSNGPHKDNQTLIKNWGPLLTQAKVPFYLCGHDHTMQHLEIEDHPTSFVVTGGGGYQVYSCDQRHPIFAEGSHGFAHLEITPTEITTRLLNQTGACLHAFSRRLDGKTTVLSPA